MYWKWPNKELQLERNLSGLQHIYNFFTIFSYIAHRKISWLIRARFSKQSKYLFSQIKITHPIDFQAIERNMTNNTAQNTFQVKINAS